jgi:hypothetical protein
LKAPGFNPWNLKCDILVSKFAFEWGNVYRYSPGEPDLDMNAAGQDPLTQLGSQVSSYSAVFSI